MSEVRDAELRRRLTPRPVDTIILATGFETTRYLSAIDVYGRDGVSIHDAWRDGPKA